MPSLFPPAPVGLKGRSAELRTLAATIEKTRPTKLALVGAGGSGKSMLAAALGHRLKRRFGGRVEWFRAGGWDHYTLTEMMALRFGIREQRARIPELRALLSREERLIVLDNHENDAAMMELFDAFGDTRASFLVTARRCLLSGIFIFPVTSPLVTSGEDAFPRVARLTRLLRWNPLALDIADHIVAGKAASVDELETFLTRRGVSRVRALDHEDDVPEIALLVDWAWTKLSAAAKRLLAVLAHLEGDHADRESLLLLGHANTAKDRAALPTLLRFSLVQEPLRERYTLHAVVRHAVLRRTRFSAARLFEHYVSLLERHPERLMLEQSHLFGAMDHAHRTNDLRAMLRIEALLRQLEQ